MVWIETPTNPALSIVDIAAIAKLAHGRSARVVVDNTFATPYLQQPLALGADAVVHSSTKYLGGHSDVVGGFVAVHDAELADELRFLQNAIGAVPVAVRLLSRAPRRQDARCPHGPALRERTRDRGRCSQSTMPSRACSIPGLPNHPGHDVARRQMKDFGGMVSFTLAGGENTALDVVAKTRLFTLAESLGAVESLIEHPARMTHASAAGSPLEVDPALVRLSVGIETTEDLVADLRQALDALVW